MDDIDELYYLFPELKDNIVVEKKVGQGYNDMKINTILNCYYLTFNLLNYLNYRNFQLCVFSSFF